MADKVTLDFVTYDPSNDEFALYFVEEGPWPVDDRDWHIRLRAIQDKVFNAVDAAVDGGLAKAYSDSVGKKVRIQIDSPSGCPEKVHQLITRIGEYIRTEKEYAEAIRNSSYVSGIRVVTGMTMGRFKT